MRDALNATPVGLTMELRDYLSALRTFWWIPCALAVAGFVAGWIFAPASLYESRFRATVVMAGDTENPGSAERPELMILDDLLPLVQSQAFAELTLQAIPPDRRADLRVAEIQESLGESRYGRVTTVVVSGANRDDVAAIAPAAAAQFPGAVNRYLVAPGSQPATVEIIDPPREPTRSTTRRYLAIGAATFAMFATGTWLVWFAASTRILRYRQHHSDVPASTVSKNGSR